MESELASIKAIEGKEGSDNGARTAFCASPGINASPD